MWKLPDLDEYRLVRGEGTPVITPFLCGGSCKSAMFALFLNLVSNKVDNDRLDLCALSWNIFVLSGIYLI